MLFRTHIRHNVILSLAVLLPGLTVAQFPLRGLARIDDFSIDDPFGELIEDSFREFDAAFGAAGEEDCWDGCWSAARPTLRDFDSATWALRSVREALQMHAAAAALTFPDQWWEIRDGDAKAFRIRAVATLPQGRQVMHVTLRREPPNPDGFLAERIDGVWTEEQQQSHRISHTAVEHAQEQQASTDSRDQASASVAVQSETEGNEHINTHVAAMMLEQQERHAKAQREAQQHAESAAKDAKITELTNTVASLRSALEGMQHELAHDRKGVKDRKQPPRRLRHFSESTATQPRHKRVRHLEAEGLQRFVRGDEL